MGEKESYGMAEMLVEVTAKDTGPLKTETHKIKVPPSAQPDDYHSGVMTELHLERMQDAVSF